MSSNLVLEENGFDYLYSFDMATKSCVFLFGPASAIASGLIQRKWQKMLIERLRIMRIAMGLRVNMYTPLII